MSGPEPNQEPSRTLSLLIGAGLLAVHFCLAFFGIRTKSLTSDEMVHIPAGIAYWRLGDDRLNPEHPILPKLIAGFPALFIPFEFDDDDPAWTANAAWIGATEKYSGAELRRVIFESKTSQWAFGQRFLFERNAGQFRRFLPWSRACLIMVSVLLGAVAGIWTAILYGRAAGLAALALFAFCPSFLGHAPLATTDVSHALGVLVALIALHGLLESDNPLREWRRTLAMGFALALLMLTKYSWAMLSPFWGIALAAGAIRRTPQSRKQYVLRQMAGMAAAFLLAVGIVAALYLALFGRVVYPAGFMIVARRLAYAPGALVYMLGGVSTHFYSYFLICGLVKLTIPVLLLLIGGIALLVRRTYTADFFSILLMSFMAYFSILLALIFDNVGVRYMFPIFPGIYILTGRVCARLFREPGWRWATFVLLAWQGGEALFNWPNHIQYMNEAALLKGRAYYLSDSNLDWGQELPAVKRYMDKHAISEIQVLSLYPNDLEFYGIKGRYIQEEELLAAHPGDAAAVSIFSLHDLREDREPLLKDWRLEAVLNDVMYVYRRVE